MTGSIHILPPDLASQIAAGEVVERPASVVKELIENALDAGAARVTVSIRGGGLTELQVTDDGMGMTETDAPLCLGRHATSKLRTLADLDTIASCGFRGEALPSIASVSRLQITTRHRSSDSGSVVSAAGTTTPTWEPAGAPVGTTVLVRELFFNVPARRKFLKSTNTESGHVAEVVLQAALTRPDVAFDLLRDGRKVREYPRCRDRAERVAQILEGEELIACSGERGPLIVEAFLTRPERARQGAGGLKLIVNGRAIRDRALAATIAHAYGSVLERGRYPRGVVFLDLPGRLVDVNVHPQKVEVRFAETRAISDAVYGVVARRLGQALAEAPREKAMPSATPESGWSGPAARILRDGAAPPSGQRYAAALPHTPRAAPRAPGPAPPVLSLFRSGSEAASSETPATEPARTGGWKNLRFLSQVKHTFLVCEGDDGLYVLDQHAAAERVIFGKLHKSYQERAVPTQALLFPALVEVSAKESEILDENKPEIDRLGLDVRVRGPTQASVHGIPKLLAKQSPEQLLQDLLRELARSGERAFSNTVDKVLATMACHAAVRAGDPLSAVEAQALLSQLDSADFASYCPHGRPIVTFSSWLELERKVGRR